MWKGIDVSDNNGAIEWAPVKAAGVEFAVLRSVRRSGNADRQFSANIAGCRKYGIPFFVYKYTYAVSEQEARNEARQVVELLRKYGLEKILVWWDVEDRERLRPLGRSKLTACIVAAQKAITEAGYRFGIYTGWYVYEENWFDFDRFGTIPMWVARYPSYMEKTLAYDPPEYLKPDVGRVIWGWQYSSRGIVPGIRGHVDLNICYRDPAVIQEVVEEDTFYVVSIADVATKELALKVAAIYPGCIVHRAAILDAGGLVIWLASVADVWTREEAQEAQRHFMEYGLVGLVHHIRLV